MAIFKFNYSVHLSSPSLFKDGICSTIGTILGIALFVNTFLIRVDPGLWWIDPTVSTVCGVVALLLSAQALFKAACIDGIPICSPHWWAVSEGDTGGDTSPTGEIEATGKPGEESEVV